MARKISDDERELWRAVTRAVAPLRRKREPIERTQTDGAVSEPASLKRKPPLAARPPVPTRAAPAVQAPPAPALRLERRLKQRLARGSESVDARLDLHGRTQSQAHNALLRFLQKRQADGAKVVLVITGKGRGDLAGEPGVLKRQVPLWLQLPEFRGYVLAVEEAHVGHGGEGALYVRLRRTRMRP
jgi:DNA-nicking Smr family endonuclease